MKLLAILACAALSLLCAQENAAVFSISNNASYPEPEKRLKELTAVNGKRLVNHFCAIGYRYPNGEESAWAYWKEANALILWEPSGDPVHPISLTTSRRFLHLDHDVVPSESAVQGSSYRVTKAWVARVLNDCQQRGEKFVVSANKRRAQRGVR